MKKLLALLLTVAMLVSVVYVMPITASAQEVEVPVDAPVEIQTDFGVDEVDDSIPGEDEDSSDETVLYAEIERYVGDTSGDKNIMENVSEKYEASFASALSSYIDVDEFKEYVIDAFDTCTTSQVNISSYRIPTSKWNDLCNLIFYDIPELFQVQTLSGSYSGSYLTAIQVKQYPTYCDTASEYTSLMNRVTTVANQLLAGIKNNSNLTNLQKMILLHDRIATYCEYDPNQLSNGEYRDQDYTMTGVFVDKVAVCQGYANAYNYLLKQVGIESYQCRSTALCHAWNLVKVGSYYYHVDITWDDTGSPLDSKGRVAHNNFLRSNTGIWNTGHEAYDYDKPTNNSTYDSYFWQNSNAEFVLVGNTIYYYDSTCGDLKTYSGTVKSNQSTWSYGRILADGNYIYITTSSSVLRYDTTTNTTSTVYTPSLASGYEIYGLYKDGSYIYCTSGSTSTSTQTRHQVVISNPTPPSPSATTLSANNSYSASITSGGQVKTYSFTPTTSGKYVIYSTGSDDTKVSLCNSSGSEIISDDDGGDGTNFRLEYNLTAGTTYQFKVKYYSGSKTGTINFKFGNVFTISYNANGGSGAPATQYKDYGKSITLSSTTPTRSSNTFRGWATNSSATTATYQPGATYSAEASVTLYAVWNSSTSGGTLSVNSSYSPSVSANSYKEYTFTPSSSGKYVIYSTCNVDTKVTLYNSSGSVIDSDDDGGDNRNFRLAYNLTAGQTYRYKVEFYSSSNSGTLSFTFGRVYTVTYNANGGSGAPSSQEKDYGCTLTLTTDEPVRSGHDFEGWATSGSSSTVSYQPGATYTANADLTLYAVWTSNAFGGTLSVNTSYSPNIAAGTYKEYTFTPSSSAKYVIYSTCNVDTKVALYNSSGVMIASDDDGGDGVNFRLAYNLTAGQTYRYRVQFFGSSNSGTLSFTFGRVYTVTYNANSGSGAPSSQEKDYGRTLTLSSQEPVRPRCNFEGWATSSSSSTVSYQPGATYTANADLTLYAVWSEVGGFDYPELEVNETYSATIESGYVRAQFTPTKTAKYIIHSNYIRDTSDSQDTKVWLYDENGNLLASDDDSGEGFNFQLIYELQAGHTYIFELSFHNQSCGGYFEFVFGETYSVTYNANGGKSAPKAGVKGYQASMTLSSWKPTRSGYIFLGWATSKKATTATYKKAGTYPANKNSNVTLYAVWKKGSLGTTAVFKGKLLDYNTVKVFWRAVPGADGYRVYYKKASAKSYKYVGIVTGTSYTNDFTVGTKYNFKVIPCMQNNNGTYTNGKAKTLTYSTARYLNAPSWLTATLYGYDDVQLKWGKVPYATKYKIYYKKNGASSYTYKGMTSSTSYKMANLTDGSLYNFKVLPCMSVNGSYFDAYYYRWIERYTLKKVPTPTIYKYSSSRILIEINNILGETGYEISKSTSKSGTNVVYTIFIADPGAVGGYYHKDLYAPVGKTYYYKVRAFSTENGKKIYGPWSTAVKYKMS